MRWLILSTEAPPVIGGIASWVDDVTRVLRLNGQTVTVLSHLGKRAGGVSTKRIKGRSWTRFQGFWCWWSARSIGADIVLCASWELASWIGPSLKKKGALLLVAAHGSDVSRALSESQKRQLRGVDNWVDHWLPMSRYLQAKLRALGCQSPSTVLPVPLKLDNIAPSTPTLGLICAARSTPLKGIERSIQLATELGKTLHLVGDIEHHRWRSDSVLTSGPCARHSLLESFRQSAAALLLSTTATDLSGGEGLGLCLIEAASVGCPPMGSNVGGIPEAIGPGILWEPTTALAELQDALSQPRLRQDCWEWVRDNHGENRWWTQIKELRS